MTTSPLLTTFWIIYSVGAVVFTILIWYAVGKARSQGIDEWEMPTEDDYDEWGYTREERIEHRAKVYQFNREVRQAEHEVKSNPMSRGAIAVMTGILWIVALPIAIATNKSKD